MSHDPTLGLRFARRVYLPRVIGLGLALPSALAVFSQSGAHPWASLWLTLHILAWPHVAYRLALASADPARTERRNLLVDSAVGGVTIALVDFSLLPTVLWVAMLAMDKIASGGPRLFWQGLAAQAVACAVTAFAVGASFRPETSFLTIVACVPLLVAYPATVSVVTYGLARRVSQQNRLLAEMSRTDGLTGLANRAHWEQAVRSELKRHQRSGRAVSLLMIDLDHFKRVNDEHGHATGDDVLRGIARLLRDTLREYDTAGRYGGEEFGVVLPDTEGSAAMILAERIRRRIEETPFGSAGVRCTASIGLATLATGATIDERQWVERADAALYRAKAAGRNRVVREATV